MTPERWARLKALFEQAVAQPAGERDAWVAGACQGDAALRDDLGALLRSHDTLGDFLETPPVLDAADVEAAVDTLLGSGPPASDELAWSPGTRIGKYDIVRVLGRGGMGIVYLARDADLHRDVALKSIPHTLGDQPAIRERLRREARAAATIKAPSVATVYAIEEVDGHLLVASEYVTGPTLRDLIQQGPVAPDRARAIALDVARALDAAHAAGVVHRDLKPENVVLGSDGHAKVVDFGIAYVESDDTRLTRDGQLLGTPAYMAPEQLLGSAVDARTDVYAFGVVLQELLLGRHPMAPAPIGPNAALRTHERDPLFAVAARCAQPDPTARYATARQALAAIEALEASSPGPVPGGTPAAPRAAAAHTTGAAPRWWWEFHQGATAVAYALILIPVWRARVEIGGAVGRAVFTAAAAAVIVSALLRLHLWFTSRFYPEELRWARARVHRWVTLADWGFVAALAAGAALVAPVSALDIVLFACAVGAAVAFLLIEPATARAAGLRHPA